MPASHSTRVWFTPWLLAGMAAFVAGCKEAEITDVPVAIARIDVSVPSLTLKAGQSATVSAVAKSGSGRSLTARPIQWTTSNAGVAQISAAGQVTAVAAGTAVLTASSGSASMQINVTVTLADFSVRVDNLLLSAINVTINGSAAGSVAAATARTFTVAGATTVTVAWQMVRQVTTTGVPIGDEVGGTFDPVTAGTSTSFAFEVDNEIGADKYFGLLLRNSSTATLLVGVNVGLASQNLCNCLSPNSGVEIFFGYYRLFANSNVRAYKESSNYTGGFVFWDGPQINGLIQTGTGAVHLFTVIAPTGPASTATPGDGLSSRSQTDRSSRGAVVYRNDHPPERRHR